MEAVLARCEASDGAGNLGGVTFSGEGHGAGDAGGAGEDADGGHCCVRKARKRRGGTCGADKLNTFARCLANQQISRAHSHAAMLDSSIDSVFEIIMTDDGMYRYLLASTTAVARSS